MFNRKRSPNLLSARRARHRRAATSWIGPTLIGLCIFLTAVLIIALPFILSGAIAYQRAAAGRAALLAAQDDAENLRIDDAISRVDEAVADFRSSRSQLDKLRILAWIPYVNDRIEPADQLLATGTAAAEAARDVLAAGRDLAKVLADTQSLSGAVSGKLPDIATVFKDMTPAQKRGILEALALNAPQLRMAASKVDSALASFDGISETGYSGQLKASLAPLKTRLLTMRTGLNAILPVAEILPGVLGFPTEKTYLLFLENSTELRPTGGFLSMVGLLKVKDADLASVDVSDVYAYDGPSEGQPRPVPPEPIRKYIGIDKWYLRDANWSPDFVVSAGLMRQFFSDEAAVRSGAPAPAIDGIIAVTPRLAQDVLRLTGPITIEGHKFDANNLIDELEFQVEQGFVGEGISREQRKNIVGALLNETIKRVSAFSLAQLLTLVGDAREALAQGDILLYSNDSDLQRLILEQGWGGKLAAVDGDYLTWIDANLASLKTDSVMSRSLSYQIRPAVGGGYVGRAAMTYSNRGSFTWKTTRYRTYARVYVPAGSELVSVSGAMENDKIKDPAGHPGKADVGDDLGRRWFGAFISIEPGETKTLEFTFKLAPSVAALASSGAYRLEVQKQAGTGKPGLTLDLDFGKKLASAEPPENPKDYGDTRYRIVTDLGVNRLFQARLEQ